MRIRNFSGLAAALVASAALASNLSAQLPAKPTQDKIDSGRFGYTKADVEFVSGMIGHHAQAVTMAGWAADHGASPQVALLCSRIILGQTSEIGLMQSWLRDRHEPVPDPLGQHDMAGMSGMSMSNMDMPGMSKETLMPGMLSPPQMDQLKAARGVEFDRLFLTYMIQHHRGALTMVEKLFNTDDAGYDDFVFKFATAVNADQSVEIDRMGKMLNALPAPKKGS